MDFDPYKVLKVDPSADEEVISAAYRALSKKYHPDLNKTVEAQAQMRQVNRAYEMLKDPTARAKIDADIASSNRRNDSASNYTNTQSNRPTSAQPSYSSRYSTGGFRQNVGNTTDSVTRGQARVGEPGENTFYLFQKRLVDDSQKKLLRVAVYHDSNFGKICNINATAPDNTGRLTSGSVFLQSIEMFDVTDAIAEALATIEKPSNPIETNYDHNVYYRRKISGLNSTYMAIEVIKYHRGEAKQALFLIGERRGEGVVSTQTEKQLRQVERILTEAFATMR